MADGYFERGEIYAVRMDSGFGSEEGAFRPGVIVSCNEGNRTNPCVIVAYLTTKARALSHCIETMATGRRSWVLCDQLSCVDKTRLGRHMGTCGYGELREIDEALEMVLDLGYNDTAALAEKDREIEARDVVIQEKDAEIESLKRQLNAAKYDRENAETSYKVENAMWQKLYECSLNQLVEMKLTGDVAMRMAAREEPPKVIEVPKPEEKSPVTEDEVASDERVDINHCTITALKKLGFSLAMAKTIKERRPYESVSDLKKVPGLKATQYRIMESKLKCTPVIKSALADPDPGYEVEETVVVVEEEATPVKVNVNTASAKEISEKTGMSMTVAYGIVGKRKRDGAYKSLEDLLNPPRFTQRHLDKFGPMLEV